MSTELFVYRFRCVVFMLDSRFIRAVSLLYSGKPFFLLVLM